MHEFGCFGYAGNVVVGPRSIKAKNEMEAAKAIECSLCARLKTRRNGNTNPHLFLIAIGDILKNPLGFSFKADYRLPVFYYDREGQKDLESVSVEEIKNNGGKEKEVVVEFLRKLSFTLHAKKTEKILIGFAGEKLYHDIFG